VRTTPSTVTDVVVVGIGITTVVAVLTTVAVVTVVEVATSTEVSTKVDEGCTIVVVPPWVSVDVSVHAGCVTVRVTVWVDSPRVDVTTVVIVPAVCMNVSEAALVRGYGFGSSKSMSVFVTLITMGGKPHSR
jgi:hypothetical protein